MTADSGAFAVCLPPSMPYVDGLFVGDGRRLRIVRRVLADVEAFRSEGRGALADVGTSGLDAPAAAARLYAAGARRALVLGGEFDGPAASVLRDELAARGIAVSVAIEDARGAAGFALNAALAALPEGSAPTAFDDPPPSPIAASDGSVFVLVVDEPAGDEAARVAAHAARFGAAAVRIAIDPPPIPAVGRGGGASWALRFGIERAEIRARVREVVRVALPHGEFSFEKACALYDMGLDPLVAAYARRGVADRNLDLLDVVLK